MLDRRTFIKACAGGMMIGGLGLIPGRAFGDENGESTKVAFTEDVAQYLASQIASGLAPDISLEAAGALPFFDDEGQRAGYIVQLISAAEPHGYVILDKNVPGLLSEYVFERGVIAPCFGESVHREAGTFDVVVKLDPLTYARTTWGSSDFVTDSGEVIATAPIVQSRAGTEDYMIDLDVLYASYTVIDENHLVSFSSFEEWQMRQWDSEGRAACIVTAALNVLDNYGLATYTSSEYSDDVRMLWSLIKPTAVPNGYSATVTDCGRGVAGVASARKGKTVLYSTGLSPTFDKIKSQVNKEQLTVLALSSSNGGNHAVTVEGWASVASGGLVLRQMALIADGWHGYARALYFDSPWEAISGVYFTYQRPPY